MNGPVRWLGALRIADTRVPTPQLGVILLGADALILAMVLSRRRRWWIAAIGWVALALSAFWICAVPPHPQMRQGVLELTAIDVGQGDSILLVSPQGRTLLVDAGGIPPWMHSELDIGEDVVSPYLWSRGISSARYRGTDPRARRPYGRYGSGTGQFSPARAVAGSGFAKSGIADSSP